MFTCSITGMPFYQNPKAVLIPILISKKYTDTSVSNVNVRPFPVSVRGVFQEDLFYIDPQDKNREDFMLSMISELIGRHVTWSDFLNLRGSEKEVEYDDKDYVLSFFACHQNVYDSIVSDFKARSSFSNMKLNFNDFSDRFVEYIHSETKGLPTFEDEPYRTKLGTNRSGSIVPNVFNESDLPYLAEVKFINTFLSMIGKKWESCGICAESSDSSNPFDIYKNSILSLS